MSVTGWKLNKGERASLLQRFPPEWPDVIADHITLHAHAGPTEPLPPTTEGEIIGSVNDGRGLQAMVIAIDGSPRRPDGGTYHITWSLDRKRGRTSIDSNEVIQRLGWRSWERAVPLHLIPARF